MNNIVKTSTSEWKIVFENRDGFLFKKNDILEEKVEKNYLAWFEIKLKMIEFNSKFIDLCMKELGIEKIEQNFDLIKGDAISSKIVRNLTYTYRDVTIKSTSILSDQNGISAPEIIFVARKKD